MPITGEDKAAGVREEFSAAAKNDE